MYAHKQPFFFSFLNVQSSAGDYHYSEFQRYSAQYADHCELVVNNQLNKIQNTTGKTWKDYNEYRRKMILSVFDIVAEFSTFDPILYKGAINREILTRKIYTDPVNFTPGSSIANDENKYTVPPSRVNQLVASTLFTNVASAQYAGFIGNINRYLSLSRGEPFDGPLIGNQVYEKVLAGVPTNQSIYEVGVEGIQNDYPRNIGLRWGSLTAFQNFYAGGTTNLGSLTRVSVPPKNNDPINITNFTHQLSDIILPGNSGSSFAWTHVEVNPTGNYLSTNQINLIAGTKASESPQIKKGPRFIGGDLLTADWRTGNIISPSYQLSPKFPGTRTSFRVRVRYGANSSGSMQFTFGATTSSQLAYTATGYSPTNTKYNQFRTIEFFTPLEITTEGKLILVLYNTNSAPTFVIDRLELIPMIGLPTEYNEPQKLETAKKAVTDLFTN